ncbi:hypothetical protein EV643_110279, partial [Kribbella sp. VKM Ac-2527]
HRTDVDRRAPHHDQHLVASINEPRRRRPDQLLFEDVLRPRLGLRRDAKRVLARYTTPLLRSSETLERQINNFVRNVDKDWYRTSEYYRLSTLYCFAEYLGWVRLIERRFGFISIEHSRAGRRLDARLNGLFGAMASFRYFRWATAAAGDAVDRSGIPRRLLAAMGEVMIVRQEVGETPMEFSDFCVRHANDRQFQRWFRELDAFLESADRDPLRWDRLIVAGANLRALVAELDASGAVGRRAAPVNIDLLHHEEIKDQVRTEFAYLLNRPAEATRLAVRRRLNRIHDTRS